MQRNRETMCALKPYKCTFKWIRENAKSGVIFMADDDNVFDLQIFEENITRFAVSTSEATVPYRNGFEEDLFLQSLRYELDDLEPKGNNCSEVLAWHTRTTVRTYPSLENMKKEPDYENTNPPKLYTSMLTTARKKT
ncbi:galactosylgalactosylxylosylprotein 3-beta-glucuronosyltransferase S-like [Tachypleus tridentatus]|uniref:galactosylgalactosylxylosylprotein 3-beta-glucuronosyltransferase S-like n=1 Tax=Tachypleus tridentatus TaxID=6853 RepID=UPI003FCEE765